MKYAIVLILFLVSLSLPGCKDDASSIRKIDRAELLLRTNPDSSRLLLDSVPFPDNLSDREQARWCMLSGHIADTLFTNLPYSFQLERAWNYYLSHGTPAEQAQISLYL